MHWEAIGAIGEVAAAFLIVVSLIYLGVQVRIAAKLGTAEAERDLTIGWNAVISSAFRDERAAEIYLRGFKEPEALTLAERGVFHGVMAQVFNTHWQVVKMARKGLLDHSILVTYEQQAQILLNTKGGAWWWREVGSLLMDDAAYFDELHKNGGVDAALTDLEFLYGPST